MASSLISLVLLITSCWSVAGTRNTLFSVNGHDRVAELAAAAPAGSDGICSLMVESQGYDCEEHTVTTKDGYILSIPRIPNGKSGGSPANRPPIVLQHGLLMDAITWLLLQPNESLAFQLADNGYDVWLPSTRGTKYSQGHTSLTPDDAAYWNWSWDELTAYDLPDTLGYVQEQTGQKVHYVGHSLGTLMAFAAFSKNQLIDIVKTATLLSPIAYVGQVSSPLARHAANHLVSDAFVWLGIHEFNPDAKPVIDFLKVICNEPGVDCTSLLNSFTGKNCCLNSSIVDTFLDYEPQPTATKNMIHIAQMIRTGTIAMYDYGNDDDNKQYYNQTTPPVYNMSSIPKDIPLYLSYGGADALSDENDVNLLLNILKDHDGDKLSLQYIDNYAHADFVMAENAKQLVYDPVIAFLKLQG